MKINLESGAEYIISCLMKNGFEAFAVGGCIRDSLMGKNPSDWDICTCATPNETVYLFENLGVKTFKTGMQHGTITILYNNNTYEVTTYRVERNYFDSRHPESVNFVKNLKEDLSRRDFTVNAMAYNNQIGLVDCFDGQNDIKNKILRAVGNPQKRFSEDALRILRCLRFSSVLGFEIEKSTAKAACSLAPTLRNISVERINTEFSKIITGKNAEYILLNYTNIMTEFIPEIKSVIDFEQHNIHHIYDIWTHTVKTVINSPQDLILRLTMFFHDIGKPQCFTMEKDGMGHFYGHADISADIARKILTRLRYDNETIKTVTRLIHYHDIQLNKTEKSVKKLLNKLGESQFDRLLQVKRADTLGLNPIYHKERLKFFDEIAEIKTKILMEKQCFSLKDLAVKGGDLMEIGIPKGPVIGKILDEILNLVLENKLINDKDEIIKYVKEKFLQV